MRLEVTGLCKSFWFREILQDIEFQLEPGEIVALIGANGVGKTTLLRVLACIYAPSRGRILCDGVPLTRRNLGLRRRLHMVPDHPQIRLPLTVMEHIANVGLLYGQSLEHIEERLLPLMTDWGIEGLAESWVGLPSRGQCYKICMAALELADPELWLLDEPFASGMDPAGLKRLKDCLLAARDRHRTILFTTQMIDLAEMLANRVAIMQETRMLAVDSIEAIRDRAHREKNEGLLQLLATLRESRP